MHHPIFNKFEAFQGQVNPDFIVEYLGERYRQSIILPHWGRRQSWDVQADLPHIDEEYFEWIDLLESAVDALDTFTMLELGAGFGRWTVRAAQAARQLGKHYSFGLAEAEPKHIEWLRMTLADNSVALEDYNLFQAAVGGAHCEELFAVKEPQNTDVYWFGQALFPTSLEGAVQDDEYYGRPLWRVSSGWGVIRVPVIPLSEILEKYEFVDLMDMDIQGAEANAIEEGIELMSQRVRRVHVGTHGHDLEDRLRSTLGNAGWHCLRDFPCLQINETPYGQISFVDGCQTWINPSLAAAGRIVQRPSEETKIQN